MPGSKIPIASQYLYDLCFATGAWFPKWAHWNDRWYKTPICQISRYVWIFIHEYVLAEVMRICIGIWVSYIAQGSLLLRFLIIPGYNCFTTANSCCIYWGFASRPFLFTAHQKFWERDKDFLWSFLFLFLKNEFWVIKILIFFAIFLEFSFLSLSKHFKP
jgi:hypothetical protein